MNAASSKGKCVPVVTVSIREEADVVAARQRARQVAALAGFGGQDQVRIATAVSELARNAFRYGHGGRVDFELTIHGRPQVLWITVSDQGPGIAELDAVISGRQGSQNGSGIGLIGSKRLMDSFQIVSTPGHGTTVHLSKCLPPDAPFLDLPAVSRLAAQLTQSRPPLISEEQIQKRDLLETLESLRLREVELETRNAEMRRVNAELEETNRGVVALYAELDEKAAALRSADELKGRFLQHVSHEFRTPLNSVLALTHLLLRRTDGELTAEQELQVGFIRKATQDLTEMVNDLLDLAKVESGKTELHLGPVVLSQLFGALRGLMRPLVVSDSVSLVFEEPPPDFSFQSDESKITQILRNLISNALKFTEHGEVRVSYRASAGRLELSVSDTGIGIAPEDHERIFREFAQVNNAIQGRVKGTGLGLPLSRKLAALLGGELTVSSVPGRGSTFVLDLPLDASAQASPQAAGEPCPILLIDDDESARYVARQRLRGTRHRIIEASGGIEGAERARFESPCLILLDLSMPDRSGFEVIDELKADPSTRDIPVIIHTSRTLRDSDWQKLAGRHAAVLPKGEYWPDETLQLIRDLLGEQHLFNGDAAVVPEVS